MARVLSLLSALVVAANVSGAAQAQEAPVNVTGEWVVYFSLDVGPEQRFTMDITQTGTTVKGSIINDRGEFPVAGTVTGKQLKISWTLPSGGQLLQIVFTGTVEGNKYTGRVMMGTLGEGPLEATKTS